MIEEGRQRVFRAVERQKLCPTERRFPLALSACDLDNRPGLVREPGKRPSETFADHHDRSRVAAVVCGHEGLPAHPPTNIHWWVLAITTKAGLLRPREPQHRAHQDRNFRATRIKSCKVWHRLGHGRVVAPAIMKASAPVCRQ
jgi:hypothetical protein